MATLKNKISSLMTTAEVAHWLRVSPNTLRGWRQHRVGPVSLKIGGHRVVYRPEDVEAWLAEQPQSGEGVA